jgi:hypothetical protein
MEATVCVGSEANHAARHIRAAGENPLRRTLPGDAHAASQPLVSLGPLPPFPRSFGWRVGEEAPSGRRSPRSKKLSLQRVARTGTVPRRGGLGTEESGLEEMTGVPGGDWGQAGWGGGDGVGPGVCGLEPGWIVRPKDGIRGGDRHECPLVLEVQLYYSVSWDAEAASLKVVQKAKSPRGSSGGLSLGDGGMAAPGSWLRRLEPSRFAGRSPSWWRLSGCARPGAAASRSA